MPKGMKHARRRPERRGSGASSSEQRTAPRSRAAIYWILAIGLAATAVYLGAVGNDFVLDDTRLIRDNPRIRSLANVPSFFASSYWEVEGPQALYRPLVLATYAANYAVHGLSSDGYTAVNIALHAAVSILLFVLVRGMAGSLTAAGVTGLAFAVHPVHTEAVAGISGRPELLAAFFFLLVLHFHQLAPGAGHQLAPGAGHRIAPGAGHRLAPGVGRNAVGYRAGVLACFACALLSKESAITLLLVLPIMDALVPATGRDGRPVTPRARIVTDYLPVILVALVYLALRRSVLGGLTISEGLIAPLDNPMVAAMTTPLGDRMGATPAQAIMTAFAVVVEYARLLFYPARLSPDYSYNQIPLVTSALDGRFISGVMLAAACAAGVALLWRRSPIAAFGLAFLALTFSIVSNFVVTIGTICAERLIYLPSAGVLIALGIGADRLATTSARRRLAYGALAALMIVASTRTWTRNRDWKNELTLWSAAIEVAPGSARVQSEYGRLLMGLAEDAARTGRTADAQSLFATAQAHFETALKIYPSYSLPMDGLAMIHSLHERFDEAGAMYERALKVWPGNFASLTNWGSLLWERSKRSASRALALRAEGKGAEADALAREADGTSRQALEKIDRAIAMQPSYAHAHLVRAQILDAYVGDSMSAIAAFEEVLRLMPNHAERAAIEHELERLKAKERRGIR
jgi:tetratricopeptide (TPR) repeat protein